MIHTGTNALLTSLFSAYRFLAVWRCGPQRNYITRTTFGVNVGFATDWEYMDPINNPQLYESINVRFT